MEESDAEDSPVSKSKQHDIYQMNKKEKKGRIQLAWSNKFKFEFPRHQAITDEWLIASRNAIYNTKGCL